MKTYINIILAYANLITKTDMKLAYLIEGYTLKLELILNADWVQVQESSDC